ncbi:MAG: CRISPR-associated endonuclease Cas2 [Nannocystaceae bacterium]
MPLLLVAYDIPDDRRRTKVSKALVRMGRRVQYSVFIVRRGSAEGVAQVLRPLIDPSEDDVRIHPVCAAWAEKGVLLGKARGRDRPEPYRVI